MNFIAQVLYKFRVIFLILLVGGTVALIPSFKMEENNTMQSWFKKTDSAYVNYKKIQEYFKVGEYEIIVLEAQDIFSYEILQYIKEKTFNLENIDYVDRVQSLANANKIIRAEESLEVRPLLEELNKNTIPKIKSEALNDALFKNYLVSEDGKITCIVVNTAKELEEKHKEKHRVVTQIKDLLQKGKPDSVKLYFGGDLEGIIVFDKYTEETLTKIPFFMILLIFISIILFYRSIHIFIIFIINILFCTIWVIGIYNLLGYTFNTVTGMLIPFIFILLIEDIIFVSQYFDKTKEIVNKKDRFIETVAHVAKPCFLASFTTALGFFSLTLSPITAVKTFGVGCAIGIMCAYIITIIITPQLLLLLPQKGIDRKKEGLSYLLNLLFNFIESKYRLILVIAVAILILASFGIMKLQTSTNYYEFFPKDSPINKAAELINTKLSGNRTLEILIEGEENALIQPKILKKIENFSLETKELLNVKKIISLVDYVKEINDSLTGEYKIPSTYKAIAQELFLFTSSNEGLRDIESFATEDYSKGRIIVNVKNTSSEQLQDLINIIEKKLNRFFQGTNMKFTVTGEGHVWSVVNINLASSQINSFGMAFLLITGIMFFIFRKSLIYGMVSIIPNILPIFLCLGMMGWMGIKLNSATVTIASIALGIVVNNTIHILSTFIISRKRKDKLFNESLRDTIVWVGKPVIITSLINMIGFSALLFAGFLPTVSFGILLFLIFFFACLSDLIVLPASMILMQKRYRNL